MRMWSADAVTGWNRSGAASEALIRGLYADHGRAMLAYATRLTGGRAIAESVVQQALVMAWRHADHMGDGLGPVRARLLILVHDLAAKTSRADSVGMVESRQDAPNLRRAVSSADAITSDRLSVAPNA